MTSCDPVRCSQQRHERRIWERLCTQTMLAESPDVSILVLKRKMSWNCPGPGRGYPTLRCDSDDHMNKCFRDENCGRHPPHRGVQIAKLVGRAQTQTVILLGPIHSNIEIQKSSFARGLSSRFISAPIINGPEPVVTEALNGTESELAGTFEIVGLGYGQCPQ